MQNPCQGYTPKAGMGSALRRKRASDRTPRMQRGNAIASEESPLKIPSGVDIGRRL